jgi:hypothetical protein
MDLSDEVQQQVVYAFQHEIGPFGGLEVSESLGPTLNDSADSINESISGVAGVDLLLESDRGVLCLVPSLRGILTSRRAVS